jgi:tetratricopeptide (TPR) repeat protein
MVPVKRVATLVGVVVIAAAAVATVERLNKDRRYQELLADGERALDLGHSYPAIEAFSGALALRPTSMVAYYRRGEAYGQQGQFETAVRDLRAARALAPGARQPLEALGRLYERRQNYAEAARWYALAADTLRDADPALLYSLALARYRAGDPAGAREPLRVAIASDDSLVRAHFLLSLVYRDSQEPERAIGSLQRAIKLAPSYLAPREELADIYRALGRTAEERAELAALAGAAGRVSRTVALALADIRAGRLEAAQLALVAAEASAPDDSRVALAVGRLHLARAEGGHAPGALPLAIRALESALGGTARRSEGLALYGRALYLSGDVAAAEQILRDAVRTSPVDPEAFAFLADAAEAARHHGEARDALLSLDALEGDTVTPAIRAARAARIATLALAADDPATALRVLDGAVASGATDPRTLALLSRARWDAGDRLGARLVLAEAVARHPLDADLERLTRLFR